jgi:hypothetical protein
MSGRRGWLSVDISAATRHAERRDIADRRLLNRLIAVKGDQRLASQAPAQGDGPKPPRMHVQGSSGRTRGRPAHVTQDTRRTQEQRRRPCQYGTGESDGWHLAPGSGQLMITRQGPGTSLSERACLRGTGRGRWLC